MQTDPRLEPSTPLLRLQELKIAYGGIQAVKGIALELHAGETVCLIGANGAGKTTTLNAIAGVLPIAGGDIHYKGERINALPAHRRLRAGIALVPEGRGIFTRLTVEENLRMGAYTRKDAAAIEADLERVYTMLPRVKERLAQVAGTLSGGEQQMVAIGRALLSRPRLLLLDEPSMGLAPLIVEKIFEVVQSVAREGVTILLVEQNANLALEFAQRGYVMESGRITLTGSGSALLQDPKVRAAYLGEEA
ncbi:MULTISPECIES: ABC transporter ATP-binding protein [Thauera]|jgi:branched-chain amino acid transport system ATP-binding protein|uniref:ABC transporter ATP-binding protein n=1 Tax=Thauera aminoaromatica TaxID=164330 RepID=C4K9K1_THASP|nr:MULTISPECIES: ABC transporter ATP-binding protein [Thauera]OPZ04599.1 MAG: High-affinity branched-chain amino acid transport ATP-binding protein LivF [Alphaproteobacteria bacterium ADurb.BinA305]ACR01077.1 ABC transporter related [Thauera aminoaromatica]MBP6133068.1 ABC transporter ATP-binding protein [Thauera sp.]MCK6397611.1 ABC transporter ATP-binding protein [Thauera aminoaromatica]TXH92415.1 MAG: ABC transporter ATP-binding protein [Thauera aminoaromatica]